jgi:hypothetical protein
MAAVDCTEGIPYAGRSIRGCGGATVADSQTVPPGVDATVPSIARVYDVFLGGKDNFAVDREVAAAVNQIHPNGRVMAGVNRALLGRVVRFLTADVGIRQFLDLGSGLPTRGNVHEIAQAVDPSTRVVYVDNDPMVLAHGRALLADNQTTTVIMADIRRPAEILESSEVRKYIDFNQPVGLLAFAILHHFTDDEDPAGIAATLRDAVPSGSHMGLAHFFNPGDEQPEAAREAAQVEKLFTEKLGTGRFRSRAEIMSYFGDWELLEPGLVLSGDWRPDPDTVAMERTLTYQTFATGVARKP